MVEPQDAVASSLAGFNSGRSFFRHGEAAIFASVQVITAPVRAATMASAVTPESVDHSDAGLSTVERVDWRRRSSRSLTWRIDDAFISAILAAAPPPQVFRRCPFVAHPIRMKEA